VAGRATGNRLGDGVGDVLRCLLSYCGCTADAEVAAQIFGGDLTTSFGPVLFGSQREILAGIRARPPGS